MWFVSKEMRKHLPIFSCVFELPSRPQGIKAKPETRKFLGFTKRNKEEGIYKPFHKVATTTSIFKKVVFSLGNQSQEDGYGLSDNIGI